MSTVKSLALPYQAMVLDVGAGEGAFSQRLIDAGFLVTAVELEQQRFRCDTPCYNLDLNTDFSQRWPDKYHLVVATEIIEHLNNPKHFISNCLGAVRANGWLIVTSPNVESWLSRISFLRDGRFLWFSEADYLSMGHITPIFSWQIRQICYELKAELVQISNTSNKFLYDKIGGSLLSKVRTKAFYMSLFYFLMKGNKDGEINVFLIRKTKS
jgi:SAM-dependent methyltransferase